MNNKKHKILLISEKIPTEIENMLFNLGFELLKLRSDPSLPSPVSHHADMLIFCDSKCLITTKKYYEANIALFENIDIITTDEDFGNKYPMDVILNCFVFSDTLFGRLESLPGILTSLYENKVNLAQGYAKCSTLLFGNNAVTADRGIASALRSHGATVLEITPGHICLPGYDYGFIGGASFVYEDKIIFFGDISLHPDYNSIKEFAEQAGYTVIYTQSNPLYDLGGAINV